MNAQLAQARAWLNQGRHAEAVAQLAALAVQQPAAPQVWVMWGIALVRSDRPDEARGVFEQVGQRFPGQPWRLLGPALIEEAQHHGPKAVQAYTEAVAVFPGDLAGWMGLARVQYRQGDLHATRQALARVLSIQPSHPDALRLQDKLNEPRKVDVINRLVERRGLQRYLEYNKPRCELALPEVVCPERTLVCIAEHLDETRYDAQVCIETRQIRTTYAQETRYLHPEDLPSLGQTFDIIFFDPTHFRPEVDRGLVHLCRLLAPGGYLVVHDCFPKDPALVGDVCPSGNWCGRTYQAFANFHRYNREASWVVDIDFGVGLIRNQGLQLDYPLEEGPELADMLAQPERYNRVLSMAEFIDQVDAGSV